MGRAMDVQTVIFTSLLASRTSFKASPSSASLDVDFFRCMIAGLYVSLSRVANRTSQTVAKRKLIHITFLQPNVCAMAPAIAGPMAPPMSGASMTIDIGEPRSSDGKTSPMTHALSTFEATAVPVRNRAKMRRPVLWLVALMSTLRMKRTLAALKTG